MLPNLMVMKLVNIVEAGSTTSKKDSELSSSQTVIVMKAPGKRVFAWVRAVSRVIMVMCRR